MNRMCLAVPGKILSLDDNDPLMPLGRVSFGGIIKEINLTFTPEAKIGDFVLVHAGFAINKIDEDEAGEVFKYLNEISDAEKSAEEN